MAKTLPQKDWKTTFEDGLALVKAETQNIIEGLGIKSEESTSWRDLPSLVRQFSTHNRTPIHFVRNLDTATYETREKLKWNTKMASQLALKKIREKAPWHSDE